MTGHEAVYDLAFCSISSALCNVQQRFFDAKNETELEASTAATDPSQGLLIAGAVNALSLYHLGSRLHFQDAEKLKQYVNDKANSLLSRSFSSFFGYNSSSSEGYSSSSRLSIPESPSAGVYRTEQRAVTLSSLMDFQDVRRRILRLSSDPCGTGLVAAADSLGRVTLFDSNASYYCIVRLWKGLRDARFAWSTVQHSSSAANTSTSSSIGSETAVGQGPARHGRLCLSIYAPQLGLVSMYAMRHGPCLRIIPVGMHCHLETLLSYGNDCGTAITP